MKKILLFILSIIFLITSFDISYWKNDNLDEYLDDETMMNLDANPIWWQKSESVKTYLIKIWVEIMYPVWIAIAILIIIISFYKLMFSEKDDEQKKWTESIIWWVIWILIMSSAKYIWTKLVWWWWDSWIIWANLGLEWNWSLIAERLYNEIFFPFIKIATFLAVWVLFTILLINAFKFISNPSDDIKKHAKNIVIWNIIWIFIILLSKSIVESIYWMQNSWWYTANLWQVWEWILSNRNYETFFSILNWSMSFIAFIVVCIIIYQAYLMVAYPDDEDTTKKLKQNIVYIIIWIMLIWWSYLIVNFLIQQ